MKYKTIKIERPEWCEIGTVVKSKRFQGADFIVGITHFGWVMLDNNPITYKPEDLEPVPAWEPTPGEYCAFWDESEAFIIIGEYEDTIEDQGYRYNLDCFADHIARIAGVDCACSVDELKARTDWL